jgi:anti-sigma B factor antagonist
MQKETPKKAAVPAARMLVMVDKNLACVKIIGRANFTFSPDFKTLVNGLRQKGCGHFIIDLSECMHMDSTFLGVMAGFGLAMNQAGASGKECFELLNPNTRITELLENLGALRLFKVTTGALSLPDGVQTHTPDSINPTREQIKRTSLEAHQTLMAVNPANAARFKDVAAFLAENLKNLKNCS